MDKKRCIITPTYIGHFKYIKKYLKSFDRYLQDKDFPIYFVITRKENNKFSKIIKPYENKLDLNVVFLDDIFKKYGISEEPDEVLKLYGRLSFQTLKKLYAALFINYEEFLLLDSESELISPTNMNQIFDDYFKKPTIVASRASNRLPSYKNDFTYNYIKAVANILKNEPEYWLVESYNWFYELRILKDLIKDHGSIINIIKSYNMGKFNDLEGILECLLYYEYIINNNKKYNYNLVIFDDEIKKYNPEYIDVFNTSIVKICGMFEQFSQCLNKENASFFEDFIKNNNLKYVLRFENSFCLDNILIQNQLIQSLKPNILASSQKHCWGIEYTFLKRVKLLCKANNIKKLKKHTISFLNPLIQACKWIFEPLIITKYLFKSLMIIIKNFSFLLGRIK